LYLSEGQFEGIHSGCFISQAFIVGSCSAGSAQVDGFRRFRRGYIEEGQGQWQVAVGWWHWAEGLSRRQEAGAEIYAAGATKEQAGICSAMQSRCAINRQSWHKDLMTSGGPGREYNLAYLAKGSFFRPISRETKRTGSGPRPHFALCDEVHEHPDRGVIEMLERGFKFRRQPLLVMITNSGTDRNSIAWEEHEHAIKVAAGSLEPLGEDAKYVGDIVDDTSFSYVCALGQGRRSAERTQNAGLRLTRCLESPSQKNIWLGLWLKPRQCRASSTIFCGFTFAFGPTLAQLG
jgi:hypothetical protein